MQYWVAVGLSANRIGDEIANDLVNLKDVNVKTHIAYGSCVATAV